MITDFKWLHMPLISQYSSDKVLQSDIISSAIIYNYYQQISDSSDLITVSDGKLTYPESITDQNTFPNTEEILNIIGNNWSRIQLLPLHKRNDDYSTIGLSELLSIIHPIRRSIEQNNPVLFYSGLPSTAKELGKTVIISGYMVTNETCWLFIDDPDIIPSEDTKRDDYFGTERYKTLFKGCKELFGCRYKVDVRALLSEKNDQLLADSLFCDHPTNSGFTVLVNSDNTETSNACLIDLEEVYNFPMKSSDENLEITDKSVQEVFDKNETMIAGGGFPFGSNRSWHGGVHFKMEASEPIHAVSHGEVVCVRMPEKDPDKDNLSYGSRNFVLLKHAIEDKEWYSLYYHLESFDFSSPESSALSWLANDGLIINEKRNLRSVPSTENNAPIFTCEPGDILSIINKDDDPWYKVRHVSNGIEGFIKFSEDRMSEYNEFKEQLNTGNVVIPEKSVFVKSGELIGYAGEAKILSDSGEPTLNPVLHWEIFSNEMIPMNWIPIEDTLGDWRVESSAIVKSLNSGIEKIAGEYSEINDEKDNMILDENLDISSISTLYSQQDIKSEYLRLVACKFFSEYAVIWSDKVDSMLADEKNINPEKLSLYCFWDVLDISPDVWHYNPIEFMRKLHVISRTVKIPEELFLKESTFITPNGLFQFKQAVKDILAKFPEDSDEPPSLIFKQEKSDDLASKRNDVLNWYYSNDIDKLAEIFINGEWSKTEQAYVLSCVQHPLGGFYYPYSFIEPDFEEQDRKVMTLQNTIIEFKKNELDQQNATDEFDQDTAKAVINKFIETMDNEIL